MAISIRVFRPYGLPAGGGPAAPESQAILPSQRNLRTLADRGRGENHGCMAALVHNLDHVVWALLTVVMVITALALFGFLFLAAI